MMASQLLESWNLRYLLFFWCYERLLYSKVNLRLPGVKYA